MVEKINIKDTGITKYEDSDTFSHVEDKQVGFDSEKGFAEHEVVIQRKSDNKFFIFTYTEYQHGESDFEDQIAYEAERIKVVTYKYIEVE